MPHANDVILVVDDDPETRTALIEYISVQTKASAVVPAVDGVDALEQLRGGLRPCVIVLDLHMPRLDGRGFRREQVADGALRDIPVIVYSATYDARQTGAELGLGYDQVVAKASDPARIVTLVRRYCAV